MVLEQQVGVACHLHTGSIVHCFHMHVWMGVLAMNGALLAANLAAHVAAHFTHNLRKGARNPRLTTYEQRHVLEAAFVTISIRKSLLRVNGLGKKNLPHMHNETINGQRV